MFYLHCLPNCKTTNFVRVCDCSRTIYIRVSSHSQPISTDSSDDITQSHNMTLPNDSQLIINTSTRPRMTVMAASTHPQVCEQFYDYLYQTIPPYL